MYIYILIVLLVIYEVMFFIISLLFEEGRVVIVVGSEGDIIEFMMKSNDMDIVSRKRFCKEISRYRKLISCFVEIYL